MITPRVPDRVEVILVPVDGSPFSERALPVASRLAGRLGADIRLFSAVDSEDEVAGRKAQLAALEPPCRHLQRRVVVSRDPAGAIHEELRQLDRAVACMASHGRGRSAALVGSVASGVVARGHDPLVLVGPMIDERLGGKRVLACVDDTPESAALVTVAIGWARLLGDLPAVVTVAEPVPPPLDDRPVRRMFGPDGDADAFLENLVRPWREQGEEVETEVIYDPIGPAVGMYGYLRERPAPLVVVGSHARSGVARIVFGSVAAAIVHESPSPVLVVPRPDAGKETPK